MYCTMAHTRWVIWEKWAWQRDRRRSRRLAAGRVAEGESGDRSWPGFEAADETAANPPAAAGGPKSYAQTRNRPIYP